MAILLVNTSGPTQRTAMEQRITTECSRLAQDVRPIRSENRARARMRGGGRSRYRTSLCGLNSRYLGNYLRI